MNGRLHVLVFRYPATGRQTECVTIAQRRWSAVKIESAEQTLSLPITFDRALRRLSELPRFFIEPDGSFVWVQDTGNGRWQVDGQLNDGPHGLMSAEIRGELPLSDWDHLLACLGAPNREFVYQSLREGITLEGSEFRRFVWGE